MTDFNLNIKDKIISLMLKNKMENKNFLPSKEQVKKWYDKNSNKKKVLDEEKFDVVIVSAERDLETIKKYIDFYFKNLNLDNIIIITKITKESESLFSNFKNVILLDEDKILDNLTYQNTKNILEKLGKNTEKTGWYLQQFLKMGYSYKCKNKYYLIFDADTIPINSLNFFEEEKIIFNVKSEYYKPYFNTIRKLFNDEVKKETNFSFISEHMAIDKNIMLELIKKIEKNNKIDGKTFFEKIINLMDENQYDFSEFETYGNYVLTFYKEKYKLSRIRSLRECMKFFDKNPKNYVLKWLSRDWDTISFEKKYVQKNLFNLEDYINRCFKE